MTDTTNRRVGPNDAHLFADYDPEIFDAEIVPDRLAAYLAHPQNLMILAFDGARAVGQCAGVLNTHPDEPTSLCIDNLGVAPTHQRRGIARQLVEAMFAWGREHGCTNAWVTTERDNEAARALYESLKGDPVQTIVYYTYEL